MIIKIKNFGCQINYESSNKIKYYLNNFKILNNQNFDILFINTCSVRENCHKNIFFFLKKNIKINFINIFNGCFSNLFYFFLIKKEYVNIIINNTFSSLYILLFNFYYYRCKQINLDFLFNNHINILNNFYIIIAEGCNKYCSYCIIPYTKGREVYKNINFILKNLYFLNNNFIEVCFLGQNVNSYLCFIKNKILNFYIFIKIILEISKNISFFYLTSNFKNLKNNIFFYKKLNNLHLPLQSASNFILNLMNRKYNFHSYKNFIYFVKNNLKYFIFTTDIIICFPSENIKFFNKTLLCIEKLLFDKSYIFLYNIRSYTNSIFFFNNINLILKKKRFAKIIFKIKNNLKYIDKTIINKEFYFMVKSVCLNYNYLFFSFYKNRKFFFFIYLNKLFFNKFLKLKIKKKNFNGFLNSIF